MSVLLYLICTFKFNSNQLGQNGQIRSFIAYGNIKDIEHRNPYCKHLKLQAIHHVTYSYYSITMINIVIAG